MVFFHFVQKEDLFWEMKRLSSLASPLVLTITFSLQISICCFGVKAMKDFCFLLLIME